jgi:hypothetical protein
MIRLIVAAVICVFVGGLSTQAFAAPVSEATVEKACGDKIQGGCVGDKCATGCEKTENGKLYSYTAYFRIRPVRQKQSALRSW